MKIKDISLITGVFCVRNDLLSLIPDYFIQFLATLGEHEPRPCIRDDQIQEILINRYIISFVIFNMNQICLLL